MKTHERMSQVISGVVWVICTLFLAGVIGLALSGCSDPEPKPPQTTIVRREIVLPTLNGERQYRLCLRTGDVFQWVEVDENTYTATDYFGWKSEYERAVKNPPWPVGPHKAVGGPEGK